MFNFVADTVDFVASVYGAKATRSTLWTFVIIAGASPGETKMWAAVRENGDFFALAVRITGKVLEIDGYMLRDN